MNHEEEGNQIIAAELKAKEKAAQRKHELDFKRSGRFDIENLILAMLAAAIVSGVVSSCSVYHSLKSGEEVCQAQLYMCMDKSK